MTLNTKQLAEDALNLQADRAAVIRVADIDFQEQVRKYCEMNQCGKYGSNWSCPPAVGPVEELKAKAGHYRQGLLVQTVHQVQSSFDMKGMMEGKEKHDRILREIYNHICKEHNLADTILLSAGSCELCKNCTYKEGKPCRFPDKALASLEAYGIDVVGLVKQYDIPYYNGKNTVSYVGLILFNQLVNNQQ